MEPYQRQAPVLVPPCGEAVAVFFPSDLARHYVYCDSLSLVSMVRWAALNTDNSTRMNLAAVVAFLPMERTHAMNLVVCARRRALKIRKEFLP